MNDLPVLQASWQPGRRRADEAHELGGSHSAGATALSCTRMAPELGPTAQVRLCSLCRCPSAAGQVQKWH